VVSLLTVSFCQSVKFDLLLLAIDMRLSEAVIFLAALFSFLFLEYGVAQGNVK
jgi:hypothetical protein